MALKRYTDRVADMKVIRTLADILHGHRVLVTKDQRRRSMRDRLFEMGVCVKRSVSLCGSGYVC